MTDENKIGWRIYVEHVCAFTPKRANLEVDIIEEIPREDATEKAIQHFTGRCPMLNPLCGGDKLSFSVTLSVPRRNISRL